MHRHRVILMLTVLFIRAASAAMIDLPTPSSAAEADTWAPTLMEWLNATYAGERNVRIYGATSGDDTDDSAAFAAAIAAAGDGGWIYIPGGVYDIDVPIDMSTTIVSWIGDGTNRSVIQFGDLSGADAITVGTVGITNNCWVMSGVSLVTEGGAGLGWIEDVIQANRLMHGIINDVQIACETTRAGIHLNGCIYWDIRDYVPQIGGQSGWSAVGAAPYHNRPYIGLHIDDIDGVMASNVINVYNMRGGLSEYIILCDPNDATTPSGNITIIGGSLEAAITQVVHFENTDGIKIIGQYGTDLNADNPYCFANCDHIHLDSVRTYEMAFHSCRGVTLENCLIASSDEDALYFDENCNVVTVDNCGFQNAYSVDSIWDVNHFSVRDCWYTALPTGVEQAPPVGITPTSKRNLMYNSEMRITGGDKAPLGWTKPADITWTQTVGRRSGAYAAQAVAGSATASTFTHPHIAEVIQELEDGYGCFVAWVKNTDATNPYFRVRVVSTAHGNKDWFSAEWSRRPKSHTGTWQPVYCPFFVYDVDDVTDIQITYWPSSPGTTAIADPMIVAGAAAPRFWEPGVYRIALKFAGDDTTPSVAGAGDVFFTGADNALDVTDFDDGKTGQIITIIGGDSAATRVKHDASYINLAGGVDWTGANGDVLALVYDGTDWNEISRSDNTP